ncbi:unnamed protein product, partial [Arabidopsis halleri]
RKCIISHRTRVRILRSSLLIFIFIFSFSLTGENPSRLSLLSTSSSCFFAALDLGPSAMII